MKKILSLILICVGFWACGQNYFVKSTRPTTIVMDRYANHPTQYGRCMFFATDSLRWYQCEGSTVKPLNYPTDSTGGTTYTAGTGISISGSTISANYVAGPGITINNNTITNTGTGQSYAAGSGLTLNSYTFANAAPDQTVSLTDGTGISCTGTYPNFTITNTLPGTTYAAGSGLGLNSGTFSNTAPDQTVSFTDGPGISTSGTYPSFTITNSLPDQTVSIGSGTGIDVTGTYPSFTITNTAPGSAYGAGTGLTLNSNTFAINLWAGPGISLSGNSITNSSPGTTYAAGSGLGLNSGTFSNTAPDQTVSLTNGTGISCSGSYPNFTITNTLPGISYAAGTGLTLNSSTFAISLSAGPGISISGNSITNSAIGSQYAAGSGITLNLQTFSHTAHTADATGETSLTVVALRGRSIATTVPTAGNCLNWNGSSWIPTADGVQSFRTGIATRDINTASGTVNVAHGLGRTPKMVIVKASLISSASVTQECYGVYDGTNHSGMSSIYVEGTTTATTDQIFTSTSFELGFSAATVVNPYTGANRQTATITCDATNITFTWTKTGTVASVTANIIWIVH